MIRFSAGDDSGSIADLMQDSSVSELLDMLRTIESECQHHKKALDNLLALVKEHNPSLLAQDSTNGWVLSINRNDIQVACYSEEGSTGSNKYAHELYSCMY